MTYGFTYFFFFFNRLNIKYFKESTLSMFVYLVIYLSSVCKIVVLYLTYNTHIFRLLSVFFIFKFCIIISQFAYFIKGNKTKP